MIRCVVFDFDGTLVESNHIKRQAFFELASEFENGIPVMANILRSGVNKDRYWIFSEFARILSGRANSATLANRYTKICKERIARAPEVAGAQACLECLQAEGRLLFINSATPLEPLVALVNLRQLIGFFSGIYGSPQKKHENLEIIRAKHGFARGEMLVVGDGELDRLSANIFGCHFVAVDSADNNFAQDPSCRIPDMTGLPGLIFSNSYCQQQIS